MCLKSALSIDGFEIVTFPSYTNPNTDILRRLIDAKELVLFYANLLGPFFDTGPILHDLAINHNLFICTYKDGRHSTGLSWRITCQILEKSVRLKKLTKAIEQKYYINRGWMYAYSRMQKIQE
jgi:hypothetical protein